MNSHNPLVSTQFAEMNLFARPTVLAAVDEDSFQLLQLNIEPWKLNMRRGRSTAKLMEDIAELRPSLVVLDSKFPFEDTIDTLKQIRSSRFGKNVPLVLLSGYPDEAHRKEALDSGVTGYIAKPIVLENLQAYFTSLIDVYENRYRRMETL